MILVVFFSFGTAGLEARAGSRGLRGRQLVLWAGLKIVMYVFVHLSLAMISRPVQ
jgi:hypothetical protein